MKTKPKLIVAEGATCTGKTELCKGLIESISDSIYIKVLPSNTERGEKIRKVYGKIAPLELDKMYLDDLNQSVREAKKIIASGRTVIVDRYYPSLISFCYRFRKVDDRESLIEMIDHESIPNPDYLFLLQASSEARLKRLKKKKDVTNFDFKSINDPELEKYLVKETDRFRKILLDNTSLSIKETMDHALSILNQDYSVSNDRIIRQQLIRKY